MTPSFSYNYEKNENNYILSERLESKEIFDKSFETNKFSFANNFWLSPSNKHVFSNNIKAVIFKTDASFDQSTEVFTHEPNNFFSTLSFDFNWKGNLANNLLLKSGFGYFYQSITNQNFIDIFINAEVPLGSFTSFRAGVSQNHKELPLPLYFVSKVSLSPQDTYYGNTNLDFIKGDSFFATLSFDNKARNRVFKVSTVLRRVKNIPQYKSPIFDRYVVFSNFSSDYYNLIYEETAEQHVDALLFDFQQRNMLGFDIFANISLMSSTINSSNPIHNTAGRFLSNYFGNITIKKEFLVRRKSFLQTFTTVSYQNGVRYYASHDIVTASEKSYINPSDGYSGTLAVNTKIDFSAAYIFKRKAMLHHLGLHISNVLDQKNELRKNVYPDFTENINSLGFFPEIFYSITF